MEQFCQIREELYGAVEGLADHQHNVRVGNKIWRHRASGRNAYGILIQGVHCVFEFVADSLPATFSLQGTLFWTSVVTVLAEFHNNLVCVLKVGKPFATSEIFCVCNTVDNSAFDSMRLHGSEVGTEHRAIRQTPV